MNRNIAPHIPPGILALIGAILLSIVHPLVRSLPLSYTHPVYIYTLALWLSAISAGASLALLRGVPEKTVGRWVLVAAIFSLGTITHNESQFRSILREALSLVGITLLFFGLLGWQPIHAFCARISEYIRRVDAIPSRRFTWGLAGAFLLLAVGLAWYCFSFQPCYTDSEAQYVQAKFMAEGHLYGQDHPLKEFFPVWMMVHDGGRWFSQYQPLHTFFLALGHRIGTPWLINPLEGALTVAVMFFLARRIDGEPTAKIAAALVLASPFVFFMSSEYMNHATSLLFTTLFLLCYVETLESRRADFWALAAGFCLGAILLTRPLTALGIDVPFAMYSLVLIRRDWRFHLPLFAIMAIGPLACFAFDAWYNLQITGNPWVFPTSRYHNGHLAAAMGMGKGFSLQQALEKAHDQWTQINNFLFQWGAPCTLFVAVACLRPLQNRYLRLLLAMLAGITVIDMANQFTSSTFGPRYIYETVPALVILSAVGIRRLAAWIPDSSVAQGAVALTVLALFVTGWPFHIPRLLNTYSHYFDNDPAFYKSLMQQAVDPALVFIERTEGNDHEKKFRRVAFTQPPRDEAPVIFAIDLGAEKNKKLIAYYSWRLPYRERDGRLERLDQNGELLQ